tara:strand:+ start:84 stop:968 length:885 start_codon:yes stop_codon:yes gene_type:complete
VTTTILHTDVVGTTYVDSSFDYRRTKAIRKFIVHYDGAGDATTNDELVLSLKAESGSTPNITTPLGPLWSESGAGGAQEAGAAIVHPSNNELPLQTIEVAKLGDRRFLITASYFVAPGTSGGALNVATTMSLRSEVVAIRLLKAYIDGCGDGEECIKDLVPSNFSCRDGSANQYGLVSTCVQLKIRIPFFTATNPIDSEGGIIALLGGRNDQTTLGGVLFAARTVRFDGITMDEMGGFVADGGNTFRFKGFYEFTARQDGFAEHYYDCNTSSIETAYPGINFEGEGWTIEDFSF